MAVSIIHILEVIQVAHQDGCADFLAPGPGKFAPEQVHNHAAIPESRQCVMRGLKAHFLAGLYQTVFEIKNAEASAQACFQLLRVKGFGQVIVGTGLQSSDDIFLRLPGSEQDHVDVRLLFSLAHFTANAQPVQLGHHPIQQGEPWPIRRT